MSSVSISSPGGPRFVRMDAITPSGERVYEDLAPHHKAPLAKALANPILLEKCEQLHGILGKYRVMRFGLAGYLRVTFREIRGQRCVLHLGTHASADQFAKRYDGAIPDHIIPLEESTIMKSSQTPTNGTGHAKNGTTAPSQHQQAHRDIASEGDLLLQAIALVANKAMESTKKQLIGDIEAMGELVRGQLEGSITARLGEVVQRLERGEQSMGQQTADFAGQIQQLRGEIEIKAQLADALRAEVGSVTTSIDKRVHAAEAGIAGLAERIGQVQGAHEEFIQRSRAQDDKADQCLAGLLTQLARTAEMMKERDEKLAALERQLQDVESRLLDSADVKRRLSQLEDRSTVTEISTKKLDSNVRDLTDSVAAQNSERAKGQSFLSTIQRFFRWA